MDVNGGHYNWATWNLVTASVRMVCGEWLCKAPCMCGLYSLEDLGMKSWEELGRNCLEAMESNSHDVWPKEVALRVAKEMKAVMKDGALKAAMEEAGCGEDVAWCHEAVQQFLDSVEANPSGIMFN